MKSIGILKIVGKAEVEETVVGGHESGEISVCQRIEKINF